MINLDPPPKQKYTFLKGFPKSENIVVPNCCCDNVAQTQCSDDRDKCGLNPRVVKMTGDDVEVICGEWEIGNVPQEASGEKYNVVLPITKIQIHPKFKIDQGVLLTNYLQDDIATITVMVTLQENKMLSKLIFLG